MKHNKKTNAARILDDMNITYRIMEYEVDENNLDAVHVANSVGMPPEQVFKTLVIRGDKLKTVQEYKRDKVCQSKQTVTYPALSAQTYYADGCGYGGYGTSANMSCYKIKFDGENYCNQKDELMHGVYFVTAYGYCYPKRETGESWHTKVAFFMGKLLKHPDAFDLLEKKYKEAYEIMTADVRRLLHILDFNPDVIIATHVIGGTILKPMIRDKEIHAKTYGIKIATETFVLSLLTRPKQKLMLMVIQRLKI